MSGSPRMRPSVRIVIAAITLLVVFAAICLAANPETCGRDQADFARQGGGAAGSSRLAPAKTPDKELGTRNKENAR